MSSATPNSSAAARAKARRDRQRASGLCISCSVPALPGRNRCRYHLVYFARDQKIRRDAARGRAA